MSTLQEEFERYERGMCERGSGLTASGRIGACIALEWVKKRIENDDPRLLKLIALIADDDQLVEDVGLENAYDVAVEKVVHSRQHCLLNKEKIETAMVQKPGGYLG